MMLFLWLHDQTQYHVDIEMEGRRNHQRQDPTSLLTYHAVNFADIDVPRANPTPLEHKH